MANKYRNEVEVTLNGESYTLRPTFNCIVEIEAAVGCSLMQFLPRFVAGQMTASQAFAILSAGIKGAGDKVAADSLQENMAEGGFNDVVVAIDKFLTASTMSGDAIKKN
jgi:hypothetical protein